MSVNSPFFDLGMCCFSAKKMENKDRYEIIATINHHQCHFQITEVFHLSFSKGESKAGSGRVNIYRYIVGTGMEMAMAMAMAMAKAMGIGVGWGWDWFGDGIG